MSRRAGIISEQYKLLILAVLVGVCSGSAAVVLNRLIAFLQSFSESLMPGIGGFSVGFVLLPAIGMLLSLLLLTFAVRDNIGHGVTKVLKAISSRESRIKPHNMWSSILTSAVTIGFGGSVGAEAPIVYTGAAIGSNIGRKAGLNFRSVTILVGCGAAGAVAGIFKAPLAGVLFTLEVLMFNISVTSMMPLLVSTVSATVISYIFLGDTPFFQCSIPSFENSDLPSVLFLGVFCGLVSLYFQKSTLALEDRLARLKNPWIRWAVCGVGLSLVILLFPPLFGEGYYSLGELLRGEDLVFRNGTPLGFLMDRSWGIPLFFALVMLLKVFSMTFTNSGGGVGGTFGPTLFVGGIAGFVLARSLNLLSFGVSEQSFVLVGMAGVMAGVMQAPMTAIFLIAEITGGYELFLPLIIVSTVSFIIVRTGEKYSIYTKRLAQNGELLTHDSDHSVMTLMRTADLIRDKYPRIDRDASLRELVNTFSSTSESAIAVVDSEGKYQGYIDIGIVHEYIFKYEDYDLLRVSDLMERRNDVLRDNERIDEVMRKFDQSEVWRMPVVDENGKYLGFISRSRILAAYRDKLKELSED